MPARSKAQQRLMAAAEHGAQFPSARRLRRTLTRQQLSEFASGSMAGKPAHVKAVHPMMAARATAVQAAHAHLTKTVPGFRALPGHAQLRQTQAHVKRTMK